MRRIALWAAFLSLVAGLVITLRPRTAAASFSRTHPLAMLAPLAPPGWEVRDTPLGATEWSASQAAHALNFDDYFYKTYKKGEMEVGVYVAYWGPGRLDPALVAGHRPDICWVLAGGTPLEQDDRLVLQAGENRKFCPARFRVFGFPRGSMEVVYWHCVGGKPVQFPDQVASPVRGRLLGFVQTLGLTAFGLAPREQIFVRISTNRTINELVRSDLWPRLTASLLKSGVVERAE